MKLRPTEIQILPLDPFAEDLLKRDKVCKTLTNLVQSSPEGLVVAIHAPWGAGKSTFLRMWRHHLAAQGFRTLAFNAWETDFSDDPLVALIGELEIGLAELKQTDSNGETNKIAESVKVLKKAAVSILKRTVPVALKIGTAGLLDLNELTEEALSDFAEKVADEKIKSYESARNSVSSFRTAIANAAAAATSGPDDKGPLVFIIDELDRCRPSYAVRVLESIKHFFAVPGVVFALAVDRTQLRHSVCKEYGESFDSSAYLRRFFDIELVLPEPKGDQFLKAQFVRFGLVEAFEERNGSSETSYDRSTLEKLFNGLFRALSCSLRDQERCFTLLSFAMKAIRKNNYLDPFVLGTLIVLKVKDPDVYSNFVKGRLSALDLLEDFKSRFSATEFIQSDTGAILEALLQAATHSGDDVPLLKHYEDLIANGSSTAIKVRASRVSSILESSDVQRLSFGTLARAAAKLDLVQPE